jgi:hypothetical protein
MGNPEEPSRMEIRHMPRSITKTIAPTKLHRAKCSKALPTLPAIARPSLVLAALLLAWAPCAFAAPVFHVIVNGGQGPFDESSSSFLSRASALSLAETDPISGYSFDYVNNAFGAAGPGGLHADANSKYFTDHPAGSGANVDAIAAAYMTLDDVVVSGPAGTIMTSYTIHLTGTLEASKDLQASGLSAAAARVEVILLGNGQSLSDSAAAKYNDVPQHGSGLLQNFTGSDDLTSAPFSVTANQAFTVLIELGIDAQSVLAPDDTGSASAAAHFGNTLTFVTDGPVFDLPAGYTANSISGNIVDNHFLPVPEPARIWLLGTGCVGLLGWARGRRLS